MGDSSHGFPEEGQLSSSNAEKTSKSLEKALRSSGKRETASTDNSSPEEIVQPCKWTLNVTVVAKYVRWTGPVTVTVAGDGERSTAGVQQTQMVDGTTGKVVIEGTGKQTFTVSASAKDWRLVEAKPVTIQNGKVEPLQLAIEPLVSIAICHDDGVSPAKKYLLLPQTRKFKAVLTPNIEGGKFVWEKLDGKDYKHSDSDATVAVTGAEKECGDAEIQVSWSLDE